MSEESENLLTESENSSIQKYLGTGATAAEEKHTVHSFLYKVATEDDTTKLGNLSSDEVGAPRLTQRAYKELALVSDKIMTNDTFKDYFLAQSEILTSTSLSKDAMLIKLAVVQKRQIEDVTKKEKKKNPGWFSGRKKEEGENEGA